MITDAPIHPLELLCERNRTFVVDEYKEIAAQSQGRIWSCLKNLLQVTRRYSIVAGEISLLALNIVFLIAKADSAIPKKVGEVTLVLLSTVGIVSLPYTIDVANKAIQDTRFALKVKNKAIAALSSAKLLQMTSNVALTVGSFFAALQGVTGHEKEQTKSYHNMIGWGEITLGTGLALTLLSTLVTYRTKKRLDQIDPSIAADIRFCMDKDTLWHLIEQLNQRAEPGLEAAMEIVKKNINTQLKVTLGGKIVLVLAGDALQAVEKVYTPNSLVSAIINCSVSTAYAAKISIEKGIEYTQRAKVDHLQ